MEERNYPSRTAEATTRNKGSSLDKSLNRGKKDDRHESVTGSAQTL